MKFDQSNITKVHAYGAKRFYKFSIVFPSFFFSCGCRVSRARPAPNLSYKKETN